MQEIAPTGQVEFMTFPQADAIYAQFQRFVKGEVSISEHMMIELQVWNRGRTPYPLYWPYGWDPPEVRAKAKAAAG